MLLMILYEIILHLLALFYLPYMLFMMLFRKKYRSNFLKRLGIGFPKNIKKNGLCFWVHAISMGETKVVSQLLKKIRDKHPKATIVLSSVTETGHAEAKLRLTEADYHVYLPFDFHYVMKRVLKRVNPDYLIIAESDFWYNFLHIAKSLGAKLFLVNGKMSKTSFKRYSHIPFLANKLFSHFDLCCLQGTTYKERFLALNLDPKKVQVTGNLKLDEKYPTLNTLDQELWLKKMRIKKEDMVLVIGSTHHGEEAFFLEQLTPFWERFPHLKVFFVPRHPERFKSVANLISQYPQPSIQFTNIEQSTGSERILLIDTMGQLCHCYQIASLAVVAGSFIETVGGHNILEPSWFGVPVICGPFMHSQTGLLQIMQEYRSGIQVTKSNFSQVLHDLLSDKEKSLKMGGNGRLIFNNAQGATNTTWKMIQQAMC